jgi:hypothetical protein
MFADVADKPPTGAVAVRVGQKIPELGLRGRFRDQAQDQSQEPPVRKK